MTFEKRLAASAAVIEARLAALLDDRNSPEAETPERLAAAMRYAVMSAGKRMRPFLVMETAAAFGAEREVAMAPALAVELIHCYSLVHDDLPAMDNDALRRGQPTVWKAFDEWTAILAGDALCTLAFEVLVGPDADLPAETRLELARALAVASGRVGMAGGQSLDLEADKLSLPTHPDIPHIERLQSMKTGRLFEFACRAGALCAGANREDVENMARFGGALGAAFQLADDLLDVEGDPATVGKATAKDAAAGKATLIGLMGLPAARARLVDLQGVALAGLARFGARADVLRETLHFACARSK